MVLGFIFLWANIILFSACKKEEKTDYTGTNEIVQQIMYFAYYWNEEIDGKLATSNGFLRVPAHTKPDDYFSSLLYDKTMAPSGSMEYDRWSFMTTYKEFNDVLVAGEYKSYGYFLAQAPDYSVRVCYVYENSPMAKAGIERGYELKKLNGTDVMTLIGNKTINDQLNRESNKYQFADREGNLLPETTISKAVVKINPMLAKERYNVDGQEVG
jgi:C-terminal processing protease CtpA/Prc